MKYFFIPCQSEDIEKTQNVKKSENQPPLNNKYCVVTLHPHDSHILWGFFKFYESDITFFFTYASGKNEIEDHRVTRSSL